MYVYAVVNRHISWCTGERHISHSKERNMKINLPPSVKDIIDSLTANGYEAFAVGGCIRDSLLGREPEDWDITTSATPLQVKSLFFHTIDTGLEHGTVTVMKNHIGYEVTTYRIDGEYEDSRHPKEVTFTSRLEEDLKRRDFTINAMAYNDTAGLVDLFGGQKDLEEGIIRCVGEAACRFTEDALRMLRAVRFAAQLGFVIEETTKDAIRQLAPTIAKVSAERIQTELIKLLVSNHPEEIKTAYEVGLTKIFLPEFDVMMDTPQNTKHHMYSVGAHTICSLQKIKPDKVLRLTMLLHDVGKPQSRTTDEDGRDHFKGHPKVSEALTKTILRRLKFDNDTIAKTAKLVLYHDDRPPLDEKSVRRAIHRAGLEQYPNLFLVKRADTLAQSNYRREEKLHYIEQYEKMYQEILRKNECLTIKDLAINGNDLITLGMEQGKNIGLILKELLNIVLDDPKQNTRENLIQLAHKISNSLI